MAQSTDENILDAQVLLYPNPTSNAFTIKKPDFITIDHILVYNMLGQLISSSWTSTIDLSSFSAGLYFVELQTNIR